MEHGVIAPPWRVRELPTIPISSQLHRTRTPIQKHEIFPKPQILKPPYSSRLLLFYRISKPYNNTTTRIYNSAPRQSVPCHAEVDQHEGTPEQLPIEEGMQGESGKLHRTARPLIVMVNKYGTKQTA